MRITTVGKAKARRSGKAARDFANGERDPCREGAMPRHANSEPWRQEQGRRGVAKALEGLLEDL